MDIKKNRKVDISFWNITLKKITSGDKEQNDDSINEVYPNGSLQHGR